MSVYDPYSGYGRYSMYRAPSTRSYYSYAPSSPYSVYTDATSDYYSRSMTGGTVSRRIYFSLDGKLISSYKIRNYRRAQKHVLNLFPDLLLGVASSRIQFYVTRPGYSHGRYVGFRAYISKHMWASEIDGLAEHETVGIEADHEPTDNTTVYSRCVMGSQALSLSLLSEHEAHGDSNWIINPRSHSTSAEVELLFHYYFFGICQYRESGIHGQISIWQITIRIRDFGRITFFTITDEY
ncbi:hypothetical protein V8E52_002981 [Russula decolorans]